MPVLAEPQKVPAMQSTHVDALVARRPSPHGEHTELPAFVAVREYVLYSQAEQLVMPLALYVLKVPALHCEQAEPVQYKPPVVQTVQVVTVPPAEKEPAEHAVHTLLALAEQAEVILLLAAHVSHVLQEAQLFPVEYLPVGHAVHCLLLTLLVAVPQSL